MTTGMGVHEFARAPTNTSTEIELWGKREKLGPWTNLRYKNLKINNKTI